MKAYGYSRRAKLECKFGCCVNPAAGKHVRARKANDRSARKTGRQIGKADIFSSLLSE